MSIVNGQSFPNTTFPDSIQSFQTFTDLTSEDETNYINYIKALITGDYVTANSYLSNIAPTAIINAEKLNQISDTVAAIQAVYQNTAEFSTIVNQKQAEWQNIINHFSYVGMWVAPVLYDNSAAYAIGDLVIYNSKTWKCIIDTTGNNVPQINSSYWEQYYYKNNIVGYYDSTVDRTLYYIASLDIGTAEDPKTNYASENPQWIQLSVMGIAGENGKGFLWEGEWDGSVTYSTGNLITYDNKCYKSLQDSNINHAPNESPTWWEVQFNFELDAILVQETAPTSPTANPIWFKTISI